MLIHKQWLQAFKQKRKANEKDYVLSEIKVALDPDANKAIIPVALKGVDIDDMQRQLLADKSSPRSTLSRSDNGNSFATTRTSRRTYSGSLSPSGPRSSRAGDGTR